MRNIDLKQVIKDIMQFGPNKVMINVDEATTCSKAWSEHKVGPDVIFIREDGWSLGAPANLAENAEKLYDGWIGVLLNSSSEPISYDTYCQSKSNNQ